MSFKMGVKFATPFYTVLETNFSASRPHSRPSGPIMQEIDRPCEIFFGPDFYKDNFQFEKYRIKGLFSQLRPMISKLLLKKPLILYFSKAISVFEIKV